MHVLLSKCEKSLLGKREEKQIIDSQFSPNLLPQDSWNITKQISCLNAKAYILPAPSSYTPEQFQKQTFFSKEGDTFPGGIYNGQIDPVFKERRTLQNFMNKHEVVLWS